MPRQHALDSLEKSLDWNSHPVIVLFGDEPFLKQQVLHHLYEAYEREAGFPATQFDGTLVEWRDVSDEVASLSLFASDVRRLAVVDDADKFVTNYRDRLEKLLESPPQQGCLVLVAKQWASNTRLYKRVDAAGLNVECKVPQLKGRSKGDDDQRILQWMKRWGKQNYKVQLGDEAAIELLETVGPKFGLLDQDLAKLALYVKPEETVDVDRIRKIIGGWRQQTVWEIIDAGLDGRVAEAIAQLDHLLQAGEAAPAIFAQISWALRRFSQVTDAFLRDERGNQRPDLSRLMADAGFRDWPKGSLKANEKRLKRLGRERAAELHRWLVSTDLALKGSHSSPARARFALEHLFIKMSRVPGVNKAATSGSNG